MILTCPDCSSRFMVDAKALGDGREVRCAKCHHEWFAMPEDEHDTTDASFEEVDDAFEAEAEEDTDDDAALDDASDADDDLPDFAAGDDSDLAFEQGVDGDDDEEMPDFSSFQPPETKQGKSLGSLPWIVGFVLLLLLASGLTLMLNRHSLGSAGSALAPLYSLVGYSADDGVMLADVVLQKLPSRRKQRYQLHCNIVNTMETTRTIPQLSMQILNKDGKVVAEEANMLELDVTTLEGGGHAECGRIMFEAPTTRSETLVLNLGSSLELSLRDAWPLEKTEEQAE